MSSVYSYQGLLVGNVYGPFKLLDLCGIRQIDLDFLFGKVIILKHPEECGLAFHTALVIFKLAGVLWLPHNMHVHSVSQHDKDLGTFYPILIKTEGNVLY